MQTNRLFEIVYVLLNKKNVTAGELAKRFGVSTRTIYRDIDTLSLAGIPVYTEKGKGGGISLLPDFVLNKSLLNENEQNEILAALHGLAHIKTGETGQVLQRLSTIFNKTATNWLEVDFSGWGFDNGEFDDFKIAILEWRIAEFDYYNAYGDKSHRRVEPIQLWFKSKAWYVKAFCLEKKDVRLFKLTRVKNLVVTDEHFSIRDLFTISQKENNSNSESHSQNVALKLRIAPEMAYRVFDEFAEWMTEKQLDGSHIVTVTWPEDNWVYGTILSYGECIEVLEPEHVRQIIREKAQGIFKKYL